MKKADGDEAIPMVIGHLEAAGIAASLRENKGKRPLTHDLFANFIREAGYRLIRSEVLDLEDGIFYARIFLGSDEEDAFFMDARPSDAVALALRFDAPIFMESQVFEKWHDMDKESAMEPFDTSDEGKKWTDLLEKMETERFGHA
nr:bifunctional nuclease family protein [Desulfobotulus pelophilus]